MKIDAHTPMYRKQFIRCLTVRTLAANMPYIIRRTKLIHYACYFLAGPILFHEAVAIQKCMQIDKRTRPSWAATNKRQKINNTKQIVIWIDK